jgi:predicted secreted protein
MTLTTRSFLNCMPGLKHWPAVTAALLAATGVAGAGAQTLPSPQHVAVLNASATLDVNKDWLTVVFSTTREGPEAATVQAQLRQALDTALTEARKAAKPGQVELHTGAFSLFPRYATPTPKQAAAGMPGGISGWQGSTELVVEGRDMPAIAQLTARIQTLSIARVGSSLSREARQQVEGDVTTQAITRFRERADAVARQFGYIGYTVREVSVSSDAPQGAPTLFARPMALRAGAEDAALPVEAGKATVTVSVSGSVQMK